MAKLAPIFNDAQLINGIPANGAKLFTYVAGSTTKQATFTGEDGLTQQANPILLDSRGEPSQAVWLTEGAAYKFVFSAADDTDPPTSPIRTIDNVTGINDATVAISQWVDYGITPTYISTNSFSLAGDQTTQYQVNRRIKATITAGTVYGYILTSAYTSLTTVTVVLDSGVLDSGLTRAELGLVTPTDTSLPKIPDWVGNNQLENSYINDLTTVTFDITADHVSIADASNGGNKAKALLSNLIASGAEYLTGTETNKFLSPSVARQSNTVLGNVVASTSGTSIDFTGIPSWAKEVTIMLDSLSTNGTDLVQFQLGDSGGIETSGYLTDSAQIVGPSTATLNYTTGFVNTANAAAAVRQGSITFKLIDPATNTWSGNGHFGLTSTSATLLTSGTKSLSGTLDRVRITTIAGANTFDLGKINVMWR